MPIIELSEDLFEQTVTEHDLVVIDYWAPWCGPCRSFAPVFEKVAEDFSEILFAKINTEEQPGIATKLNIRTVPTIMILREQVVVYNQPGALLESAFREIVCKAKELDMDAVREQMAGKKQQ